MAGEANLLVEIGAGQRDIGREKQLVWRMWLGWAGQYKGASSREREVQVYAGQ